ncbi:MAG: response regulator [Desulfobacterales bacterium]|nr:response regulator [Desulfobacterales bacterium]
MKNLSLLIVEDEPVTRDMIALKLGKEGYEVQTAPSGVEAVEMISRAFYDVIITDLMMPGGIDGIGVLEAAKARSSRTEVLLLTAHASVQSAVEAMRKGATNYLQKPVNFHELLMQLDKISSFKRMALNSEEMREALEVTEQNAARAIQDLEMEVTRLQDLLAETSQVLSKQGINAAKRVEMALEIIGSG